MRRRIFETDTRKSEHTFEPASLLDSKILRREEILDTLTHEQQNKKNMQANLKKMRKDFSKTLSSLRSEMDVVRKSMVKDAALEVKSKQRMQFLYEQLKQTEVAIGKLKDEAAFLIESEKRLSNQNDLLAKDLVVLKEGLKKVERSASKSAATNAKVIASAEADLKEAEEAHLNARDEIDRMKAEMKSIKGEMQAMQPVKPLKKLKNKYSSEHLMKKMEVELGIIEQDVVMARAACEGAVDRNSNMRRTVADETRFRQRLQDELRRVENDRVRDYSRVDDVLSNPVSRHTSQEMSGWASFVGGGILPALGSELQTWEKINQNLSGNGSQGTSSLSVSSRLSTDDGWPKMGIYDTGFRDSNPYSAFGHGALAGLDMRVSSKPYGPNSAHLELDGMIYNPSPTPVLLATAAEDIKQGYDAMDPMLGLAGHDILSSLGLDMDAPSSDFSNSLSIVGGLTTQ
ncbi:hypothetical protein BC829DRAFT_221433 [Chytridium lagenaria]|nr:hypothetical protein BC829DRAFT_221433 [Chytridium lagenaria]